MLLDELMGRTRNVLPGKDAHEMEWWDSEVGGSHVRRLGLRALPLTLCRLPVQVCKSFLCGFCPCDLFTNTRADIGMSQKNWSQDEVYGSNYTVCMGTAVTEFCNCCRYL